MRRRVEIPHAGVPRVPDQRDRGLVRNRVEQVSERRAAEPQRLRPRKWRTAVVNGMAGPCCAIVWNILSPARPLFAH